MEPSGKFRNIPEHSNEQIETLTVLCSVAKHTGSGFTTTTRVSPHFLSSDLCKSGPGHFALENVLPHTLPIKLSLVVSK